MVSAPYVIGCKIKIKEQSSSRYFYIILLDGICFGSSGLWIRFMICRKLTIHLGIYFALVLLLLDPNKWDSSPEIMSASIVGIMLMAEKVVGVE